MSPPLWVDSRVGSKEFLPLLRKAGIAADLTTLQAGDFALEGRGPSGAVSVGVERKTLGDLVGSLQGGRLQGLQYGRLHDAYDFVWLLVEGVWGQDKQGCLTIRKGLHGMKRLPGCHMTEDGLVKALLTLEIKGGLRIAHTFSVQQSVKFLVSLMRWWTEKDWDGHKTLLTPYAGHQVIGSLSVFREIVMRLPEIGVRASKAIEERFQGSLGQLLNSRIEDWSELELMSPHGPRRLGVSKAMRIIEAVRQLR